MKGNYDRKCLVQLKDGRFASGSGNGTIKLWDLYTYLCNQTLEGHKIHISKLMELQDGQLVSPSLNNTIKIWNTNSLKCHLH